MEVKSMRVLEWAPEDAAHAVALLDESDEPLAPTAKDRLIKRPTIDRLQQTVDWISEHVLSGDSLQYNRAIEQRGGQ